MTETVQATGPSFKRVTKNTFLKSKLTEIDFYSVTKRRPKAHHIGAKISQKSFQIGLWDVLMPWQRLKAAARQPELPWNSTLGGQFSSQNCL